ncbi:hypothetical protein PybrP1_008191, partial [[Pythium] brassicae (nom. inval.)]
MAAAAATSASLKYVSLVVLCLQNSLLAILMRLSRVGDHPKFNASTAVFVGEVFKLVTCLVIIAMVRFVQQSRTARLASHGLMTAFSLPASRQPRENTPAAPGVRVHASSLDIIFDQREMLRVSVPALLYVIQNNLQYVAVSNLDAASFQVLYQLKILTTAVFSVVLLKKAILPLQWGAIAILMVGVALVQLDDSGAAASKSAAKGDSEQSTTLGLFAVLAACMCSGFAGLGLVSIVLAGGGLVFNDMDHLSAHGFFYGYRPVVWAAIAVSALGGLLTAVVVKYADNILKAFATSIAIVLSVVLSIFLFDKLPTSQFLFGAFLVNGSVYIYGSAPSWSPSHSPVLPRTMADKIGKA